MSRHRCERAEKTAENRPPTEAAYFNGVEIEEKVAWIFVSAAH
jgi:hypothetical protein